MSDDIISQKSKDDFQPCFIHSEMNEFGFTATQFRVLCHISSRGECWQSAHNSARVCRMNEDTFWKAVNILESIEVIKRTKRHGLTSVFTVNPFRLWKRPDGKQGTPEKSMRRPDSATGTRKTGDTHPAENRGHKLNNRELDPMNETNRGSLPFRTGESDASKVIRPTLGMIESYLEYKVPGSRQFAKIWFEKMQKQNWCDGEGRPVERWMPLAEAYAKACIGNSRKAHPRINHRNIGKTETTESKSADVEKYLAAQGQQSPPPARIIDRNAGGYNAAAPTDGLKSKVR